MKKFLKKLLLITMISFLTVPFTYAQEEVEPLEDKEVILINNDKRLRQMDVNDLEIIQFTIDLEQEYKLHVEVTPKDVIEVTPGTNELSVYAKAVGNAKITILVMLEDVTDRKEINVKVNEQKGTLKFNQSVFYLVRNASFLVDYELEPKNIDSSRIVWESSDPSVASVENGTVYGRRLGKTTIYATLDGDTQSMEVIVSAPLEKLEFNSDSIRVNLNDKASIPDLIYVPYDTTTKKDPTYRIVDEEIAVIEDGMIRGIQIGKTQIEANINGVIAKLEINVVESSLASDSHTLLLENTLIDEDGFHLYVRNFKGLEKESFELYLPTNEILEYMSNREMSRLLIHLEDELLTKNLTNMKRMALDKEILLQLGAQKLEIVFLDSKETTLFKYFFDHRIQDNLDLSFNFSKIKDRDSLYKLVNNNYSYQLSFLFENDKPFIFSINQSVLESDKGQFHFHYYLENQKLVGDTQGIVMDEDHLVHFEIEHKDNVISLVPLVKQGNKSYIYWMSAIILVVLGGVVYQNRNKLLKR